MNPRLADAELLDTVLARLTVRQGPDARGEHICDCCFHADGKRPNLHVSERGFICFSCNEKGSLRRLAKHLGISAQDAEPRIKRQQTTYDYKDETGKILFQVVRYYGKNGRKKFFQRRPDSDGCDTAGGRDALRGGWVNDIEGVRRVPYRIPEIVQRLAEKVFAVEGEKDADRLHTLGLLATTNPGGAGKWLEDFNPFFKDRDVVLLGDNDKAGRDHVADVQRHLLGVARMVRVVELPGLPKKGDVSDWLDAGNTLADLLKLVESTPVITSEAQPDDIAPNPARIARWIGEDEKRHFARDGGGKLYVLEDGVYRAEGKRCIEALAKRFFVSFGKEESWNSHKAQEVIHFISADAPELWEVPPFEKVNTLNGILDLKKYLITHHAEDIVLLPHSPSHLSPIQIPIAFDPKASCAAWERQIKSTFPDDAQELAWEILGWLMVPLTSIQRAILFLGEGGTGKSTFLTAVRNFLGRRNISAKDLHRLESNRFSVAGLFGKLANICADLPPQDLSGTAIFKALTGGDEITGEHKFLSEFSFTPYARLMFSANRPPKSNDPSEAFFERWTVVPFEKKFRGQKGEIPRQKLDALLSEPQELSGVLNKALSALPKVIERGFTVSASMMKAHEVFRECTDPVAVWIAANVVRSPFNFIGKQDLVGAYNRAASAKGRPVESDKAFTQALRRWDPHITEGQRVWKGKPKTPCWLGIGLAIGPGLEDRDGGFSRDSRDSRVASQLSNPEAPPIPGAFEKIQGAPQELITSEEGLNPLKPLNSSNGKTAMEGFPSTSLAPAEALRLEAERYQKERASLSPIGPPPAAKPGEADLLRPGGNDCA